MSMRTRLKWLQQVQDVMDGGMLDNFIRCLAVPAPEGRP
jgi:hypothetical protein